MRRTGLLAVARHLVVGIAALQFSPVGQASDEFARAADLFRDGKPREAYQKFRHLANRGDPDAAHAALFMNKYGPLLFDLYWAASPVEQSLWAELISKPGGRTAPPFVPAPTVEKVAAPLGVRSATPAVLKLRKKSPPERQP